MPIRLPRSACGSYALRMSTPVVDIRSRRSSVQRLVSRNVKVLMAVRDLDQAGLAAIIGKSPASVGHKLSARARWSLEEVEVLAEFAGWGVARFFTDPDPVGPSDGLADEVVRHQGLEPRTRWFEASPCAA